MNCHQVNFFSQFQIPTIAFVSQVALCAGCNAVHPYAAFIIGTIAGVAYVGWSTLMIRLKIDDPLDAVAGEFLKH